MKGCCLQTVKPQCRGVFDKWPLQSAAQKTLQHQNCLVISVQVARKEALVTARSGSGQRERTQRDNLSCQAGHERLREVRMPEWPVLLLLLHHPCLLFFPPSSFFFHTFPQQHGVTDSKWCVFMLMMAAPRLHEPHNARFDQTRWNQRRQLLHLIKLHLYRVVTGVINLARVAQLTSLFHSNCDAVCGDVIWSVSI